MKNKKYGLLLFCMAAAAAYLAICSKSSPLYPMNDWVDVNCFFTVGKGILHGIVPYRDLYEQKGPILYFYYAIASLFSQTSYIGPYILDSISFGLFLYFSGKIAGLYLGDSKWVYGIVVVLAALVPNSRAFAHGGSVELISLWPLAYSLYAVTRAICEGRLLKGLESFFIGCCCAMVVYIKFTIAGFYLGLALFVALWYLLWERKYPELLKTIAAFLGGIAAVSGVVFAYFLLNGALDDLFTVYFYNNLFLYPTEVTDRTQMILNCLKRTLEVNTGYSWMIPLGAAGALLIKPRQGRTITALLLSFIGLVIGTYWGGRGYTYYGLILAAFCVYGLIAIVKLIEFIRLGDLYRKFTDGWPLISWLLIGILTVSLLLNCYGTSQNVYLMSYEKEDMPQYQFAAYINEAADATLLNYGFLDGGFYYAADVLPTCRFFCYLNIPLTQLWSEQNAMIQSGQVDFIVTRHYALTQYGVDSSRYELLATAEMPFEGYPYTYYLYGKAQ